MNRLFIKICLLILTGTVYAGFLRPPSAFSQVQGIVKHCNGKGLANVRIKVDNGFSTCSDNSGWFSLRVTQIPCNITCRKQGYKFKTIPLDGNATTGTVTDIFLDGATSPRELRGSVGISKEGIKVRLFRKRGEDYKEIDTAVTCSDGMYSFSELADGIYKIVPECSLCTFSPAFRDNMQIPCATTATFDFRAVCTPGACQ